MNLAREKNNSQPHVLIVDDDKDIRTLLSEILEKNELKL